MRRASHGFLEVGDELVVGSSIRAFVGANGGGKTLAMVEGMVLPAWADGVRVVGNMRLYPAVAGFDKALAMEIYSWRDIVRVGVRNDRDGRALRERPSGGPVDEDQAVAEGLAPSELPLWSITDNESCVLVVDEISAMLPSRQSMSLPAQLGRELNQLRKSDVEVGWTAPNWSRCDSFLREVTQEVTVCKGSWPDKWLRDEQNKIVRDIHGEKVRYPKRGWEPNRLFRFATFDARDFDEFSYSTVKDVVPKRRARYWRPKHVAQYCYDTLQPVGMLDHLDDVGQCVVCGGSRSRPKCSCGDHGSRRAEGRTARSSKAAEAQAEAGWDPDPTDTRHDLTAAKAAFMATVGKG
jgi:hypothetical protein